MIVTYNRLVGPNQQRARRSSSNHQSNIRNRFNRLFDSIGLPNLSKRGRFNFFSISNNGSSTNQQAEHSRAHLSENPDEALLFDDPYAEGGLTGGFPSSSANPYKSLTLAVT
jgi:hypothetical protein